MGLRRLNASRDGGAGRGVDDTAAVVGALCSWMRLIPRRNAYLHTAAVEYRRQEIMGVGLPGAIESEKARRQNTAVRCTAAVSLMFSRQGSPAPTPSPLPTAPPPVLRDNATGATTTTTTPAGRRKVLQGLRRHTADLKAGIGKVHTIIQL